MSTPKITKITDGLGYGNASSTITTDQDSGELHDRIDQAVHSPDLLVPISHDDSTGQPLQDDGCGDGRLYKKVFAMREGELRTFEYSLDRAKVFGGGATMAVSMLVGQRQAEDDSLQQVFTHAISMLRERGIDFGAHTDEHADSERCGCGAIDKFPAMLAVSVTYREQIVESIKALDLDTLQLDEVLDNFRAYVERHGNEPYNGHVVSEEIIHEGKVVKELAGEHIEKAIVLNTIANHTVNQALVHRQTDGQADVFAVDVWRMQQLADWFYDEPAERTKAFLSELVYTMATAAVLTRGNLPVYLCS